MQGGEFQEEFVEFLRGHRCRYLCDRCQGDWSWNWFLDGEEVDLGDEEKGNETGAREETAQAAPSAGGQALADQSVDSAVHLTEGGGAGDAGEDLIAEAVAALRERPAGDVGGSRDVGGDPGPLPVGKFEIIYADPPWHYRGQVQHGGPGKPYTSGARAFYPTMPVEELAEFPIGELADDACLLFLWATSPCLEDAFTVAKAWGFKYATVAFVWDKQRVNPGHYTMSQCELCLVFKKGKVPTPRGARNVRQLVSSPRTSHSTKPDEVRHRIDQMFPDQAKVELFARTRGEGWVAWGTELEGEI